MFILVVLVECTYAKTFIVSLKGILVRDFTVTTTFLHLYPNLTCPATTQSQRVITIRDSVRRLCRLNKSQSVWTQV